MTTINDDVNDFCLFVFFNQGTAQKKERKQNNQKQSKQTTTVRR
jgi:hypothetical protein